MSDQPDAGATSETAQTWKTIHTKHTPIHTNKANMEWWLRRPNDIRRPWGLKFPDICLTGEENPERNLTQETCPDRGLNPGPLRDRLACYSLSHSGGQCERLKDYAIYRSHFRFVSYKSYMGWWALQVLTNIYTTVNYVNSSASGSSCHEDSPPARNPSRVWRQAGLPLWGPCLFSDLLAVWELSWFTLSVIVQ